MKVSEMTILLTGANGGIGRVIAAELLQQGATLLLSSHDTSQLEQLRQELLLIADQTEQVQTCAADLLNSDDLSKLHQAAQNIGVNVLINNAGIMQFGLMAEQSTHYTKQVIQLNTLAPMLLTQTLLPHLQKQSSAQVINIGSTFGSIGYPGFASYSASKAAIQGFSEALQRELKDTAVRVKYLSPRATRTAINNSAVVQMNKELKVAMDAPEVVAAAVVQLLEQPIKRLAIGWPEKLFIPLNKLFPTLVDQAIAKQLPVIKRYAQSAANA